MTSLGRHLLIDYHGCDRELITDTAFVRKVLLEAATRAGATIVTDVFHTFNPHGVSGVVVIAESHLAVHTWPEHGSVAVDVFSCGTKMRPEVIEAFLKDVFRAKTSFVRELERGSAPC